MPSDDALDTLGRARSWARPFRLHVRGKRSEAFRAWWRAVEREGGGFTRGGLKGTFTRRANKR